MRSARPVPWFLVAGLAGGLWSAAAGIGEAGGGPPPLGEEFQVNTYTTDCQRSPAVAADASANFVVVWTSCGQDGSLAGIFGQRYDAAGKPAGKEFQVNTYTTSSQDHPAVAANASGNFVVVWQSHSRDGSDDGIFGQRLDSLGDPIGQEFQVNTYTTGNQHDPAVAAGAAGDFVVVWQSQDQDGEAGGIFGQRYDAAGNPAGREFQVNTYTTFSQSEPALAADRAGNLVVVWESCRGGFPLCYTGIFGQRYDLAGNPVGSEFQVNSDPPGFYTYPFEPAVSADASGNFVVVWSDYYHDGGAADDLFGQRFDAAGDPVGGEFRVNTYTPSFQYGAAVAADGSGNFVVAWHSYGQDGSYRGVFGQRYDAGGNAVEEEFQANTYTMGDQTAPAAAMDPSGKFVVVWTSGGDVFGQRYLGPVFADGFESGDTSAWDEAVP